MGRVALTEDTSWSPELGEDLLLLLWHHCLWSFVTAALGNEHGGQASLGMNVRVGQELFSHKDANDLPINWRSPSNTSTWIATKVYQR